jgi:hypothetical protein
VLLPRDAEVDVRVDEGRERQQALAVDDLGALELRGAAGLGDLRDLPVADDQVMSGIEAGSGIEQARSLDQEVGPRPRPGDQLGRLGSALRPVGGDVHAGCPIVGVSAGAGPRSGRARSLPASSS